jgi:hypothetical protein
MAYTTIKKPSDYFNTKLYTGDDTNDRQIALDWSPDLTWIKARNVAYGHILFDRIRGLGFSLNSNGTNADRNVGSEFSWSNSGCTTDSFTVDRGSNESLNESGRTMVAWNWKAGGTAVSNTDGSITSSVSANQDVGFSIVSYTGTGSNATVGHGLGSVPKIMFVKNRDGSNNWMVYSSALGATKYLKLNTTDAESTFSTRWNDTTPTSTVFTIGTDTDVNGNGSNYIAYCFAEKQGFSKFGSWTGNGSSDGPFIFTGFKPAFVIIKKTNAAGSWWVDDNKRDSFNPTLKALQANSSAAEVADGAGDLDFLSNGFKCRDNTDAINISGGSYIYMAFAEEPLVGDNPATAR